MHIIVFNILYTYDFTGYYWTGVPNVILYFQDNDGDENYRMYKVNITNVNLVYENYLFNLTATNRLLHLIKFIQLAIKKA